MRLQSFRLRSLHCFAGCGVYRCGSAVCDEGNGSHIGGKRIEVGGVIAEAYVRDVEHRVDIEGLICDIEHIEANEAGGIGAVIGFVLLNCREVDDHYVPLAVLLDIRDSEVVAVALCGSSSVGCGVDVPIVRLKGISLIVEQKYP